MRSPFDLSGKTLLVTGASAGIGKETALVLASQGARLILSGRNEERLASVLSSLEGEGHRASAFDLAQGEAIVPWVKGLAKESGPLDGLVHCGGVHSLRPAKMYSAESLRSAFSINVESAAFLARAFADKKVRSQGASLVFVASVMGLVGQAGAGIYGATKGALISLCQCLALELAGDKVRVNAIAPGVVETEMTEGLKSLMGPEQFARVEAQHPLGIGSPHDVACAAAYLVSDGASWITGTTLVVDGGYTTH